MKQTGDNRASQFLIQKIANDVQRGNATSAMTTIPSPSWQDWAEHRYGGRVSVGRVYFSAHCMVIDVDLQVMT